MNDKIEAALAVLDGQHEDLIRAGAYSGECCWFYYSDITDYKTEYQQARATLAHHIAAQDAEIARLTAAQTPPRSEGVVMEGMVEAAWEEAPPANLQRRRIYAGPVEGGA